MASHLEYKLAYRRNLPHIQPPGATLFITPHLHGSLPTEAIERLRNEFQLRLKQIEKEAPPEERDYLLYREEKRYFGRIDDLLDRVTDGPHWLRIPAVAQIVCDGLHNRDGKTYDLIAYCVMPNHCHIVLTPLPIEPDSYQPLSRIMHVLKGYSAHEANGVLKRQGKFWQAESYDHFVRDGAELERIIYYVVNNPVKAGLVDDWDQWPWTYWKYAPGS